MQESSADVLALLGDWSGYLGALVASDPDGVVPPADQLEIENAIARAISVLAGEPRPTPVTEHSGRAIHAKDLIITTDLVTRALRDRC